MIFEINKYNTSVEPDISKVQYKQKIEVKNGESKTCWNSFLMVKNKPYRIRVETLIFNKSGEILVVKKDKLTKYGTFYSLPGGSVEPDIKPSKQAEAECLEEAKIKIKNIIYTGLSYQVNTEPYSSSYGNSFTKDDIMYYGSIIYIFVADYDGKYTGKVNPIDEEKQFAKQCKFYNIHDIQWRKEHIDAIRFYNEKIFDTPEQLNQYLNTFDYGYYNSLNGENLIKTDEHFQNYKTMSLDDFIFHKCGVCWDYVDYEAYYLQKYLNFRVTTDPLTQNYTFCMYYMQHDDIDGDKPSHTWLAYNINNQVYCFESSWYTYQGITKFKNEYEMIKTYIQRQKKSQQEYYNNQITKSIVIKYLPNKKFNLTPEEYMNNIFDNKNHVVIKSDFKRWPVKQRVNPHLYFYHLFPKNIDLTKYGLVSLEFLYSHKMYKEFDYYTQKYRDRLVNGWKYYPHKKPEDLTREEIINGLKKFRGEDGTNAIYFFRYPPYKELGPKMNNILSHKYIYRIDINDPETQKYIKYIDWGYEGSNSDNKKLTREYYEQINSIDYFSNYKDNNPMNFAALNHISIIPKDHFLPAHILKQIKIPNAKEDMYDYEELNEATDILTESSMLLVSMYHGSIHKTHKIEPISFSVGNKFSKPSWVIFMFRQFNLAKWYAICESINNHINHSNISEYLNDYKHGCFAQWIERDGIFDFKPICILIDKIWNKIYDYLQNNTLECYVYELDVPINNKLSIIGTNPTLPEYTYSGKLDTKKIYTITITQDIFKENIKSVTEKEYEKVINVIKKSNFTNNMIYGPFNHLLFHIDDRIKMRLLVNDRMKSGKLHPGDNLNFLDDEFDSDKIIQKKNYIVSQMNEKDRTYVNFTTKLPLGHFITLFEYDEDKPIGFVELNKLNGKSTTTLYILYALDPKYRGKGIIQKLIKKAYKYVHIFSYTKIISIIDKQNIASQKALEKTKLFTKVKETKNEVKYECIMN